MIKRRRIWAWRPWQQAAAWGVGLAQAQTYPEKPVRLAVPFAAGYLRHRGACVVSVSPWKALGKPVVVENKAGAGGIVGTAEVGEAEARRLQPGGGHRFVHGGEPGHQPAGHTYNPLTDFTPIINMAATPNVIAVHPSFPARITRRSWLSCKNNPANIPTRLPARAASATCRPSCSCNWPR